LWKFDLSGLNDWWMKGNRPAFGAVTMATVDDEETIHAKFGYFVKLRKPPDFVQMAKNDCDVYRVGFLYVDGKKRNDPGALVHFYISVNCDGLILPLKEKMFRRELRDIPIHEWSHSQTLEIFLKNKNLLSGGGIKNASTILFACVANAHIESKGMIQILAKRRTVNSVFSVSPKSMATFFKDRVPVKIDGKTKRIFHIVKPHKRSNDSIVKMHFRGLRDFQWNGYKVHVSVPHLHHASITQLQEIGEVHNPIETVGIISTLKVGSILEKELLQ
jgi:hypothetical protein